VEPDVRDEVIDFVRTWSEKTELPKTRLVRWLGIARSKYHDWQERYGKVNEHNHLVPRDHWLLPCERDAIIAGYLERRDEGYRRVTYWLLDTDIVAVSPSTVYRVLRGADLLRRWNRTPSSKGTGFQQPLLPHEHWHIDISHINVCGTFYYLLSVLDGFSRYIVHWELRESMTEQEVEIILERAKERFPDARPRIISDNGPQFIARDFKEFIRVSGMTHVRTSPFYPQSNGKLERWHQSLKREAIRPRTPLSVDDARRIVTEFVEYYNGERLNSAIGYIAPKDKLEGRADAIHAERDRKLAAARQARKTRREESERKHLTSWNEASKMHLAGETDASSAGAQLARDNRPGRRTSVTGESADSPGPIGAGLEAACASVACSRRCPEALMPQKTPGSGAEPQLRDTAGLAGVPESLISERRLSNSR
jgi:putative transposase